MKKVLFIDLCDLIFITIIFSAPKNYKHIESTSIQPVLAILIVNEENFKVWLFIPTLEPIFRTDIGAGTDRQRPENKHYVI
jgi:hypothetical protein